MAKKNKAWLENPVDMEAALRDLNPVSVETGIKDLPIYVSQEQTRAKIALYFTYVFLFLVAIAILGPIIINLFLPHTFADPIESGKNLVTVLASILAGPFGFIVGFYFKQENNKDA